MRKVPFFFLVLMVNIGRRNQREKRKMANLVASCYTCPHEAHLEKYTLSKKHKKKTLWKKNLDKLAHTLFLELVLPRSTKTCNYGLRAAKSNLRTFDQISDEYY